MPTFPCETSPAAKSEEERMSSQAINQPNVVVATWVCNRILTLLRERKVHGCFKDFWRGLFEALAVHVLSSLNPLHLMLETCSGTPARMLNCAFRMTVFATLPKNWLSLLCKVHWIDKRYTYSKFYWCLIKKLRKKKNTKAATSVGHSACSCGIWN